MLAELAAANAAYATISKFIANGLIKIWKIYKTDQLINPRDDFEVIIFRPGYEVLTQVFKK